MIDSRFIQIMPRMVIYGKVYGRGLGYAVPTLTNKCDDPANKEGQKHRLKSSKL